MTWKAAILMLVLLPLLGLAAPACESRSHDLVIPDLAYVRCICGPYSNDANPQEDVIGCWLMFNDSKSELIAFKGVPVKVTVELYAYPLEEGEEFPKDTASEVLVYEGHFVVDTSRGMHPDWENEITIPLEEIAPGRWFMWPHFFVQEVTVETPTQGVFTCENG